MSPGGGELLLNDVSNPLGQKIQSKMNIFSYVELRHPIKQLDRLFEESKNSDVNGNVIYENICIMITNHKGFDPTDSGS